MKNRLSLSQRYQIWAMLRQHCSYAEIAESVGCHKSTISRELRRNMKSNIRGEIYDPDFANHLADQRKRYKNKGCKLTEDVQRRIVWLLKRYWSPEQIYHTCIKRGYAMVSTEWIYQFIYRLKKQGKDLCIYLRQGRKKRRRRKNRQHSRQIIKERVSISQRPIEADNASRIGHMEVDLVKCTNGYLLTITDRKTLFNLIRKISDKSSKSVFNAFRSLSKYHQVIKTITSDNGTEFVLHKRISKMLNCKWYFADPYSPQQRGCNENQNGLIRQFAKRTTDLSNISNQEILNWEKQLNFRPRKKLNYSKPIDLFTKSFVALTT